MLVRQQFENEYGTAIEITAERLARSRSGHQHIRVLITGPESQISMTLTRTEADELAQAISRLPND